MESRTKFKDLSEHLRQLLKSESYSVTTMKDMDFVLNAFSNYMEKNVLDEYSPDIGEMLVEHCRQTLYVCESRVTRAKILVTKLNRLNQGLDGRDALWAEKKQPIVLSDSFLSALDSFISFCLENGNAPSSIEYKRWICGRFLKNAEAFGCTDTQALTGEVVQAAFLQLGHTGYWDKIGPFLRFLFEEGFVQHNFCTLILNRKKHTPHPTIYREDEISTIERSIGRSVASGIRNYAIVLLLSRYGIRSRDITALTFENLDFENNRLHFIQQKTGIPWEGELFPEVKTALSEYIQHVRREVPGCSNIFITTGIPYKPLDSYAINTTINDLIKKSGIDTTGKRHGSRAFRSSMASSMVNDDVPTEVVRRILGHGTKHAIRHYARIDIEGMRICPLPMPEPTGSFAELLFLKGGEYNV